MNISEDNQTEKITKLSLSKVMYWVKIDQKLILQLSQMKSPSWKNVTGIPQDLWVKKIKLLYILEVIKKDLCSVVDLLKVRRCLNFVHLSIHQALKS